jgi:UDP-N-acetylglucosamine transferase subunit ALG13
VPSDQVTPDQLTSDQLTPAQVTPDQLTADQLTADQLTADQLSADQVTPGQSARRAALLVCSSGGHLTQLVALRPWWELRPRTWVTSDTPQTRSALDGENIIWGHFPTTRNAWNLLRNALLAVRLLLPRAARPAVIVSTGAGLAVPFFVLGRLLSIPTVYIEVFDRVDSRTLTGRLCKPFSSLFLVQLPEQQALYRDAIVVGSLFGGITAAQQAAAPRSAAQDADRPGSGPGLPVLLVTLGTNQHPFVRVTEWVERWLSDGADQHVRMVLQHGATPVPPGPDRFSELGYGDLQRALSSAVIVVTHGGPATIMEARAAGHLPVAVPRRPDLDEMVDGHQLRFARKLRDEGLAVVCETEVEFRSALDRGLAALRAGEGPAGVRRALGADLAAPARLAATEAADEPWPDGTSRTAELIDALLVGQGAPAMAAAAASTAEGHPDD